MPPIDTLSNHTPIKSAILIAELTALRNEIQYRSIAQHTLLNLTLTGVAAVSAFALNNGRLLFFLLIPPLCFILGTLHLDHARSIERADNYIGGKLRQDACDMVKDSTILNWQQSVCADQRTRIGRLIWSGPFFLLFIGLGCISLFVSCFPAFTYQSASNFVRWWPPVTWTGEVLLMLVLIGLWVKVKRTSASGAPEKVIDIT